MRDTMFKWEIICDNTIFYHTALNVLIEKHDSVYEILSKVESLKEKIVLL